MNLYSIAYCEVLLLYSEGVVRGFGFVSYQEELWNRKLEELLVVTILWGRERANLKARSWNAVIWCPGTFILCTQRN